jgi:hypothetical protein
MLHHLIQPRHISAITNKLTIEQHTLLVPHHSRDKWYHIALAVELTEHASANNPYKFAKLCDTFSEEH